MFLHNPIMMTKSRRTSWTGDAIIGVLMTGQDVPGARYLSSRAGSPAVDGLSNQTQLPVSIEDISIRGLRIAGSNPGPDKISEMFW